MGSKMRRSKLEMCIDILKVLAHRGPLKLTHIMYKANVNCSILNESLDFLIKQGLVEKRTIKKEHIVFVVTQLGINVLKYFRELTIVSSRKYFSTFMPSCVTTKTICSFLMVRFSTRPCLIRKSKDSLSMLQLTLALYIMCVNFNGPLCANTLRMSMHISSFDLRIFEPIPSQLIVYICMLCDRVL